jgi:hypothetical protein
MSKELEELKPSGTEEERSRAILEGAKMCGAIDNSRIGSAGDGRGQNRMCAVTY